jgi:MoxR-like ATPase
VIPDLSLADVARLSGAILDRVEQVVVGKRPVLQLMWAGMLADGHLLIEDVPGLAKTVIARSFAQVTGLDFARVQFTPDLMPSDITGSSVFDPVTSRLDFRPGPVFTNLVLGDEINRAPPKTQAAMLEAMQERQVTTDGVTRPLEPPFLVIATQNPLEFEGTYPLPEAQLDRFLLRLTVGYPTRADEWTILERRMTRRAEAAVLEPVVDRDTVLAMQRTVETVHVDESVGYYIVDLVDATRRRSEVEVGASPRASLALLGAARAGAAIVGRDFVVPDDVKAVAVAVLGHRLSLRPDQWIRGVRADEVVLRCLQDVPAPAPRERA